MTLRERIENIVAISGELKVPDVANRILLAVKEELPPKEPSPNLRVHIGWNSAIEEMERRLE